MSPVTDPAVMMLRGVVGLIPDGFDGAVGEFDLVPLLGVAANISTK